MMEIRKELREKLFHFYSDTFLNLETSLNNLGELDFYLWMNSCDSTFGTFLENGNNAVSLHHLPEFNSLLLTQEIFDDFGAALNCFTVGYFKQTQTLLRNTVELAFQIGKTKYDFAHGNISNSLWVNGIRGIEKIRDASEEISTLNDSIPEIKDKIKKLNKLYDRLCSSTHSRKDRLNIIKSPRQDSTLSSLIFEPIELLYTKRIFIYTLCLIIELLISLFKVQRDNDWKLPIIKTLEDEKARLNALYGLQNQNYEKGVLIFRENLKITKEKIVEIYSVDLNGNFIELTKKKLRLNQTESKKFNDAFIKRILNDK